MVSLPVLILGCLGVAFGRGSQEEPVHAPPIEALLPPTPRQRISWLLLACVPSSLLLGVTTYLTTDLAAVPLLWIVPLVIYLLAFIVAFSSASDAGVAIAIRAFPLFLLPLVTLMIARAARHSGLRCRFTW